MGGPESLLPMVTARPDPLDGGQINQEASKGREGASLGIISIFPLM